MPTCDLQNKKWEEHGKKQLVEFVEKQMGRTMSADVRSALVAGADEGTVASRHCALLCRLIYRRIVMSPSFLSSCTFCI